MLLLLCYNGCMLNLKQKLLLYLAALSAGALLISNLAAVKLWDFFGVAVDGGIAVFPLTYILSDLIVEFYGKHIAKHIILAGFLVNLIAVSVFYLVIALPAYPGWTMQNAFSAVLGFAPRIIAGSLAAYICANLFNNYIFIKLKQSKGLFADRFIARALGSSAFAHIVDSAIFETIAFLGVLSLPEFLAQACFAYLLGIGLELLFAPIEAATAKEIKRRIEHDSLSKQ